MERYLALKTIVETGTFTAAAEKLGYTQPALSQNIAALEAELGLVLLNRSRGEPACQQMERRYILMF